MKRICTLALIAFFPVAAFSQKTAAKKKPVRPTPTAADVAYDSHDATKLDFWKAEGEGPRPLLVYIHGGGWTGGDKAGQGGALAASYLKHGISVAAINYRLTGEAPLPAPVHDAVRGIQFLKSKAKEWNINPDRIVLTGGSAGACTSMWILCHDDMANPDSDDPIERESSRVAGAAVSSGQTSIDPKQIEPWLGEMVLQHNMINMAVGEKTIEGALANYDKHAALYKEFSAFNHVSKDDPPLFMTYGGDMTLPSKSAGHGIHHPVYGVQMKEKCDEVGMECHLICKGAIKDDTFQNQTEFMLKVLLAK